VLIYGSVYTMYFITESWLSDDISSGLIDPMQKYMVIRKDRGPARYGGVTTLVSRQYDSVIIDLAAEFNVLEVLCFDVICDGCKIRTFVVYRPPYYNAKAKAQDYIDLPIQEAQLSQRDRATLRVIEYFAESLKVIRNDTVE